MQPRWLLALAVLLAAPGCAANRARAEAAAMTRAANRSPDADRRGYATWGSSVRLREDTPPYFVGPVATTEPRPPYGAGDTGSADSGYVGDDSQAGACGPASDGGNAYGPGGPSGYPGTYLAPGGAVPPDLRPPPPPEPPQSPFAGPFVHSSPGSDVMDHRPGLSTGSGVYARPDPPPAPPPAKSR